ncbi:MAG: citramalate synthase [Clostridiaceae bacterium]
MREKVFIFDSTLRDGAQAQGISFSITDKIKIVKKLDEIAVDYIEAGNPFSNPKDMEFFNKVKELKLKNSKLSAFGSTRRPNISPSEDEGLASLIKSGADVLTIFGKSWDFHVVDIIKTTLEENILMIKESIEYLKSFNKEVVFDAEHFFDGYKNNSKYALEVIEAARDAGADWIVLCDTNGGTLPNEIEEIIRHLTQDLGFDNIGIHCHNDSGCAVANSVVAAISGARHIQGTFTGLGERSGNANLSTIIANLNLKTKFEAIPMEYTEKLLDVYRYVIEISNMIPNDREPYVGNCAFAHKGGMHIDAVLKNPTSFEHTSPESVGNERRILMSEVSGRSTLMSMINKVNPSLTKNSKESDAILKRLKELEHEGYQFEGAESSFELLVRKELGMFKPSFELVEYKVDTINPSNTDHSATAITKIKVNGEYEITAAEGMGPVNALDKALRKALSIFYPSISSMYLLDYKVRVISGDKATSAKVRVTIESTDGVETWNTIGVSYDIIEASWKALVDSVEYRLIDKNNQF